MCRSDLTSGDRGRTPKGAYGQALAMISHHHLAARMWARRMGVIGDEQLDLLLRVYKGERTFNAGVFDDTGSTLASEEKIAEHRAAGENLLELSDHGFIRILFTSSAGFVNVERITPKGREYLARYGDRLSLDQARTSHHDPARWWRGGPQTLAISFRGPERLEQ